MKNSSVQAMFAEQHDVPKEYVHVNFVRYINGTYEFEVEVLNTVESVVSKFTYISHCFNFQEKPLDIDNFLEKDHGA